QNDLITIGMPAANSIQLNTVLDLPSGPTTIHSINTGVPHVVSFVEDVSQIDILTLGAAIRNHSSFAPDGANANFAQIQEGSSLLLRTYERGVEDETLACGTGAIATGILAHIVHGLPKPLQLNVSGGATLFVDFDIAEQTLHNITLTGPAVTVFEGMIRLQS
ncbi:MAG: diaminopimelate epimerase, partial [Opitutaceae bacterium]|nr:diaminopimelate epimerase [Opitutaceae bacterium]